MTGADPARHRALFYVDTVPEVGATVVVDGDEGFHAAKVRRMRPGEHLDVGDGAGVVAHCVVEEAGNARLSAQVLDRGTVAPAAPAVTVVQALPKSDRSELAIELATEAGADGFVAWQAARCVAKWESAPRVDKGLRRWRAVTRSAARQSRRAHIPPVTGVVSTAELTERISVQAAAGGVVLVLHESAGRLLAEPLSTAALTQAESVMLVIGPEGGLTDDELEGLSRAGAQVVRLGPTVLRTSTAAAVALGAVGVLTPRWG